MKTNFKLSKETRLSNMKIEEPETEAKPVTEKEFEEYMVKNGAAGSFMVYRSTEKDDEMGIEEL